MEGGRGVQLTEGQQEALDVAAHLIVAVRRADRLGWHTIGVQRLLRIANGDTSAMVPDPATAAPPASRSRRRRPARED
ncbi:hypothetical protein AB0E08_07575 [Streptomyces sp. NPDC048281]|uniref:hypothetical protein n=1 Tax=Streptomyces sp. NPDC048281 TaxID=3154715 RepID=UPI003427A26B